MQTGPLSDGIQQGHVAREDDDGDTTTRDRGLHRDLENPGHLLGVGNQLAIVAALREELFRVGLLEVSAPDFAGWNLRGDRENGNAAAMTVVEAVDQVQVPGTAAPGADRQPSPEMCFRSRGKCCRLLMSHVNPSNSFLRANRVRDAIERVAGNTVDLPNACFRENIDQQVRDFCLGHPHASAQRQCMGHARC